MRTRTTIARGGVLLVAALAASCGAPAEDQEPETSESVATALCRLPDGQACTRGSECASDACRTYYPDADGDGEAAPSGTKLCGRRPPTGWKATAGPDCCDSDARVKTTQRGYFTFPHACGGYDYDCSGSAQQAYTLVQACTPALCTSSWQDAVPPACGTAGTFRECHRTGPGAAFCDITLIEPRPQACR
jgi:hypothetical protein